MPEGDTLYRIAEVLRGTLADDEIVAARGRPGGVELERIVGTRVTAVRTRGKHLLVEFSAGLTLHTHLQMKGSWHRYRPAERWRRPAVEAVAVLETERAVAVCFGAPTTELIETRVLHRHPVLSRLGPDLLDPDANLEDAVRRLRGCASSVAEALLDQRVVAGIGNVHRSEMLFIAGQDPFQPGAALPAAAARSLLELGRDLLRANVGGGPRVTMPDASGARPDVSAAGSRSSERWVYGRAGLPCRRCRARIHARTLGRLPRRLYWCPRCQGSGAPTSERRPAR
jgi:endonuclease VIII